MRACMLGGSSQLLPRITWRWNPRQRRFRTWKASGFRFQPFVFRVVFCNWWSVIRGPTTHRWLLYVYLMELIGSSERSFLPLRTLLLITGRRVSTIGRKRLIPRRLSTFMLSSVSLINISKQCWKSADLAACICNLGQPVEVLIVVLRSFDWTAIPEKKRWRHNSKS